MPQYERIVSLAPSNTEILYRLGVADRVVATTAVCDHPEAVEEKPSIGGWTTPDINEVQAHDPDLILAADELQDDAVEACREAGLTVKQLTPTRFHDIFNAVKQIGEFVDREERARKLVADMNERVADLTVLPEHRTRVYCEEWHDPPMAGGNWIPRMVRLAGGEYLLAEGERSREVSTAEVQEFDPEHIVLHYCGYGADAGTDHVTERDSWAGITAVEEGNVHVIDDTLLNRPSPRIVEGVQQLRDAIAPQGSEQSRT